MTRRVFILGAGFSKPAGFPLATELTDKVLDAFHATAGAAHELFKFAADVQRVHDWIEKNRRMSKINIEEFYDYATVYAERLRLEQHDVPVGRLSGETPYQHAADLLTWLSYLDSRLLEVLIHHEDTADLAPVRRFVKALRPGDTVITFNYDRLVDTKRHYDPGNMFRVNQNIAP